MRLRSALLGCCLIATSAALPAQMSGGPPAPPLGSTVSPSAALDGLVGMAESETVSAAKAMPAEKYGFAPSSAIFAPSQGAEFATVRTFVGQVTHVAEANYYFFSGWSGLKPSVDMKALGAITDKAAAVAALEASFAFAHRAVATITPANVWVAVKPIDGFSTRATIVAFAAAHANDHYGQMVEYLRMNGVVPPASAK